MAHVICIEVERREREERKRGETKEKKKKKKKRSQKELDYFESSFLGIETELGLRHDKSNKARSLNKRAYESGDSKADHGGGYMLSKN